MSFNLQSTDPSNMHTRYYLRIAAAYVRGKLREQYKQDFRFQRPLADMTEQEWEELFVLGKQAELKLHRFKRNMELARVQKVLGLLRGLHPKDLLDIGTGRGVFLWPLLDEVPGLKLSCLDILPFRVDDLKAIQSGGYPNLHAHLLDITSSGLPENYADGITFLETLEHIPSPQLAVEEACRLARRFVIVSVPSKADDNPEHIHLFTPPRLEELFRTAGAKSVKFSSVHNHLIMLAML
ncbi:MAG: class I SAM-dependent methyltransferase [Bacteroidota bacterium]